MVEFNQIETGLLVGTCPLDENDIDRIARAGASAVICLQSDTDLDQRGIDWPCFETCYRASGIAPQRVAMTDFDENNIADMLPLAVDAVNRAINAGRVVYLHCSAGRERSPTVAAAWLVRYRGLSAKAALKQVTAARNCNPYVLMIEAMAVAQ